MRQGYDGFADGGLWMWGWNNYGQIGIGTSGGNVATPMQIMAGRLFLQVVLGWYHSGAVASGACVRVRGASVIKFSTGVRLQMMQLRVMHAFAKI